MRRSKLVALAAATAVFAGSAGVAFADSIYASAATVSAMPGGTATFTIGLTAESVSGDPNGCNAGTGNNQAVTISFTSSNTAVAAAPASVSLTGCDDPATTTTVENGRLISVPIPAAATRGASTMLTARGSGGQTTNVMVDGKKVDSSVLTTTSIRVNVDGKDNQAPLSVTSPTSGTFDQTYPIATDGGSGTGTVTYAVSGTACTASGPSSVRITSGTGTCSITATKPADVSYNAAASPPLAVTVNKAAQPTLSVTSPTAGTYQDRLDLVHAGGAGTGTLSFSPSGSACQVTDGKLEILSGSGDCSVTASRPSDANYLAATSVARTVAINKKAQAPLSMTSADTGIFGDMIVLTSQGGSGNGGTTYAAFGTACSIPTTGADAGKLNITAGTGDCSVVATRSADANYVSLSSPAQTINVGRKAQDGLAVVAETTGQFGDVLSLAINGGSGDGALTYSVGNSTACRITAAKELEITSGTGTCSVTASRAEDGNYTAVSSPDHPVSATKAPATVTLTGLSATYDGAAHAAGATTVPANLAGVSFTYNTEAAAPRAAGSYTVVAALDHPDYAGSSNGSLVIAPKSVTGSFSAVAKTYNGSDLAKVIPAVVSEAVGDDVVTLVVSNPTFDTPAAGLNKTVTGTLSLDGAAASNYQLTATTDSAVATINKKVLTGTFTANDKVYNRSTAATVKTQSLPEVVEGDAVTFELSNVAFADWNVGAAKNVSANLTLSGGEASNYELSSDTASITAEITPKPVDGSVTAADRGYDGSAVASAAGSLADGDVLPGDTVGVTVESANFDDKNVGTDKPVTATLALDGLDQGNYSLRSATATDTAGITPASLQASYAADNKVYDGTTTAVLHDLDLQGVIQGDSAQLKIGTPVFENKNVGTGKAVTGTMILDGTDAGNYVISNTPTVTAAITPAALSATFAASNKVYDGTTVATGAITPSGTVFGADKVSIAAAALFGTKIVGTAKPVSVTFTLDGDNSGNYTVNESGSSSATITPAALSATFAASNKVYDRTTAATGAITASGTVFGTDVVSIQAAAAFGTKTVGTAKSVGVAFTLDGADKGNYTVNASGSSSADITAKVLVGTITAATKAYDGTIAASVITGQTGTVDGDAVTVTASGAAFASKNVGTHAVAASLSLTGTDAGNYTVNASASTAGTITAKALTPTFTVSNKEYDGTRTATITGSTLSAGVVTGEDVALDSRLASATFADALVGTAKTVTGAGFALAGDGNGNYTLSVGTTTADITAWKFSGFRQPVDGSGVLNRAKAGSAIPVKFSLAGNKGLDIFVTGSPSSKQIPCTTGAVTDDIEETVTANASGLQYDVTADQYNYVWKTSAWAGTCRQLTVTVKDGKSYSANFTFVK